MAVTSPGPAAKSSATKYFSQLKRLIIWHVLLIIESVETQPTYPPTNDLIDHDGAPTPTSITTIFAVERLKNTYLHGFSPLPTTDREA